jgi:phage terminase large subunit GpA-like protein
MAEAWNPIVPEPVPDWCESRIRLSAEYEGSGGAYDGTRRPWWREILESYQDPEVTFMAVVAATQVGKTLSLMAGILWCAENAPAPGLVVLPDQVSAMEFRDRLYAMALSSLATGEFRRLRVPPEHLWNGRWIDLGSMRVYLAWSGSRQRMRGRACKRVWDSEVDAYKGDKKTGDPVSASHQRTGAFYHFLHYHESSPTAHPSEITALEESCTDRRRWHVPCPHCGAWQELRFFPYKAGDLAGRGGIGGIHNEHGELLAPEEARKTAHYVCINGCTITSAQKQAMLEAGCWVSKGQHIDKHGKVMGPAPSSRRKRGYQLWAIHTDTKSFGDLAAAYLEAKAEGKLAEFFGNWLGLEWKQEGKIPSWGVLGRRLAWTHARGTVPHQVWFLTCGVDVQSDEVYYVVRGWAPTCTSWLVDWGSFPRSEGDETELVKTDLAQLGQLLEREYAVVGTDGAATNPLGRARLRIRLLNIDSNHRPMDVHNWLQSLPEDLRSGERARVRAVRGDHKVQPELRYRMHLLEQNVRTGEKYKGGLEQWGIYVYHFYQDLAERLAGKPNLPGSWYVTRDAVTAGKSYLQQVTNFHRVVEVNAKTFAKKGVWRPRSNTLEVDYWDCEVYDLVAAHMVVGDLGWSEESWRKWWGLRSGSARPKRKRREAVGEFGGLNDR